MRNAHGNAVSLNAGLVRNNLNIVLDEQYCEAHLYGIYLQQGQSHIDNHTVVDHASQIAKATSCTKAC